MVELTGKKLMVSVVLSLFLVGALSFELIPEYYCDVEDKVARCVYVSTSGMTCTSVIPSRDNSSDYQVLDDRCQKGSVYGNWTKLDNFVLLPHEPTVQFTTSRPVVAWNVNYIRTLEGKCYAKGICLIPVDTCE